MITGYATPEGTKKFAERQNQDSHKNYKNVHNLFSYTRHDYYYEYGQFH